MQKSNKWIEFAKEDLMAAELILPEGIYNQVCFHAQQCVEKALKAFLKSKGDLIPKTHFLVELLNLCAKLNADFSNLKDKCLKLDKYYIPTRYPDALPGALPDGLPNEGDAVEALSFAKEIMQFVTAKFI